MRKTQKPAAAKAATTVAGMLDELQNHQRTTRDHLMTATAQLARAFERLDAADAELVRVAELLGLPVEG